MRLRDQIVLITGASSGIGRETALHLAREGAIPVLAARSVEKLQEAAAEIREQTGIEAHVLRMDVQSEQEVLRAVAEVIERYGRVDILINCSGYGVFDPVATMAMRDYEGMIDVNYLGVVRVTKAVLPGMLQRDQGHIIQISSLAGFVAGPRHSGYAASKFAVMGFSEALSYELDGTGVHVTTINPGPVETPFFDHADRSAIPDFVPSLTSDQVAATILRATREKKSLYIIPRPLSLGVKLRYLFPALYKRLTLAGIRFTEKKNAPSK